MILKNKQDQLRFSLEKGSYIIALVSIFFSALIYFIIDFNSLYNVVVAFHNKKPSFFVKFYSMQTLIFFIATGISFHSKHVENTHKRLYGIPVLYINLSLLLINIVNWALQRYNFTIYESIWITITSPTKGADSTALSSFILDALIPYLIEFFCFLIFSIPLCLYLIKKYNFNYFKENLEFKFKTKTYSYNLVKCVSVILFIFSAVQTYLCIKPHNYIPILIKENFSDAEHSVFYKKNYVDTKTTKVTFPQKKQNLILIFLESMESTYTDISNGGLFDESLIPNLTRLGKENINFSSTECFGGGNDLVGADCTIAALLTKMSGTPYTFSSQKIPSKTGKFLSNIKTLTDHLAEQNYNQRFLFGSDKEFASRDMLLEKHGNVEIHDINWYKENKKLPENYNVFWGFEDNKLYKFAKEEAEELGNKKEPFFLGLLTVDTHYPKGFLCDQCDKKNYDPRHPMKTIIPCSDRQLNDFISWAKEQKWYENTTIVITGDHLFMQPVNGFNTFDELSVSEFVAPLRKRQWVDIFINSRTKPVKEKFRSFSAYDIYPSILASLGCKIEGDRLGFGVSLFSDKKTLYEIYGEKIINDELSKKTIEYESLY